MHYLYRYVCILNVFFIYVYGQLSAIKNLLFIIIKGLYCCLIIHKTNKLYMQHNISNISKIKDETQHF